MTPGKALCDVCGKEYRLTRDGMIWHHLGTKKYPGDIFRMPCNGAGKMPRRVELPKEGSFAAAIAGIPGPDGWFNKVSGQMFEKMAAYLLAKGLKEEEAIYAMENLYWASANNYK
jgi:hypothetical protein